MVDRIWWSYGATIRYYGIKEIPCYVLNRVGVPGPFSGYFVSTQLHFMQNVGTHVDSDEQTLMSRQLTLAACAFCTTAFIILTP